MDTLKTQALQKLMPLGGYHTEADGTVVVDADGVANGYTAPTQAEIDAEIAKIQTNAPVIANIAALDVVITREKEKYAKEDNAYTLSQAEEQAITEKLALRATLVV